MMRNSYFKPAMVQHVREFCQPLFLVSPISHVSYIKLFRDGSLAILASDALVTEAFMDQKVCFPSAKFAGEFLKTGLYFAQNLGPLLCDKFNEKQLLAVINHFQWQQAQFKIDTGLMIYREGSEYDEFFYLCSDLESHPHEWYLNNRDIIDIFSVCFVEKLKKVIQANDKNRIFLPTFEYKNPPCPPNHKKLMLSDPQRIEFLKAMRLKRYPLTDPSGKTCYLSPRQFECLALLSKGKSYKEMGHSLSLSARTIEYYVDQLKNTTECHSKAALVKLFDQSSLQGFKHLF